MKYMSNQTVGGWVRQKNQFIHADNYTESRANRFNEIRRQIIKTLHEEGVGLLLGSDAPQVFNVPGFSIQHELDAMIKSGLTPYEALKIGTVNPAIYFGAEGEFGTLVPGASADMILMNSNPLENVKNVQNRAGVIVRGQWLPEEEIQQRLNAIAEKYKL
jgi:imidazolonepropionase-like amidohydrolase